MQKASDDYLAALFTRVPQGLWHRSEEPHIPESTSLELTLPAFANEGRWLVQCPCGGAQYAHPDMDRFFCVDCLNYTVGGQWAQVVWPDDHTAIETVLDQRPHPRHMNWRPGETVDMLKLEGPTPAVSTGSHAVAAGTEIHPDSEMFVKPKRSKK